MSDTAALANEPGDIDLQSFSDIDLAHWRNGVVRRQDEIKGELAAIDAEIARRYQAQVDALYTAKGEMSGKVKHDLPSGLRVEGSRSKTVQWDGAKLLAVAKTMSWEQVQHFFDIGVKMPEKVYSALDPTSDLKANVDEARTVKYGDVKIALVEPEAGK